MPWRYIYEIGKWFAIQGHNVFLISAGSPETLVEEDIDGIRVIHIKTKNIFNNKELFQGLDLIVWSSSPLTVFFNKKLKSTKKPFILLFTGPFYTIFEVLKTQALKIPFKQLASHYKNSIVPLKFTADLINADFVRKAVVLSDKNAGILREKGCREKKLIVIPPGHEGDGLKPFENVQTTEIRKGLGLPEKQHIVMYLGSLYRIRGIDVLLNAFQDVCKKKDDLMLLILARTDNKEEIDSLYRRIMMLGIENKTVAVHGFLEKSKVMDYLYASNTVVLPFILVPSDMPLGALEAMALGKPVIATDVDGMPEMVRDRRGLIIKPGDKHALAEAIMTLSQDSNLYNSLTENCLSYMSCYPTWEEVTNHFYHSIISCNGYLKKS